jgi:hypothetical protein
MGALMLEKQGNRTISRIHVCRFLQNARICSVSTGKNQRFDSRWSNDFLQTRCLGVLAIGVLIYAEKIKSESDLQKMIKIMEELLKIKKNERHTFTHAHPSEKNEQKGNTTFNEF